MTTLSRNCLEASQRGEPDDAHVCTGGRCACECHHVPPPEQLREIYQEAKEGGR